MEKNKNGESVHEEPKMKLLLNNCDNNNYRFASDGETPTHSINYNSWSRVTPSLFENIDECRDIFGEYYFSINLVYLMLSTATISYTIVFK